MAQNQPNVQDIEKIKLYDDMNRMQIDQLLRATLNFSNNSLETKKLCVSMETGVFTLLAGIYREKPFEEWILTLALFGILIPLLFYIVDAVLWFYQDSLREKMIKEENEIRARHRLHKRAVTEKTVKERVMKSLFNGSQAMYFGLMIAAAIVLIFLLGGK